MVQKIRISEIRTPKYINGEFNESFNMEIDLEFLEYVTHFFLRVSHGIFSSWPVFQPIHPVSRYTVVYKVILTEEIIGEYKDKIEVAHQEDDTFIGDDSKDIIIPIGTQTPTPTPTITATPTATPTGIPPLISFGEYLKCIFPRLLTGDFTPRVSTRDMIPRISCIIKVK